MRDDIIFIVVVLAAGSLVGWLLSSLVLRIYPDIDGRELHFRVELVLTAMSMLSVLIWWSRK